MEPEASSPAVSPVRAVLVVSGVGFATTALPATDRNWLWLAAAACVALVLLAVARAIPSESPPVRVVLCLAVGCDLLIALLRQATGGSQSGYAPLLILPVAWVAFVAGRRGVGLLVAATAVTLATPIVLIGAPDYPETGGRGALLVTIVAAVVGAVTALGVGHVRRAAEVTEQRARRLDRLVRTQTAIAMSDFGLHDVLDTVAAEALDLTGADAAVVELPDGEEMVYRAVAGGATAFDGMRLHAAGSASGHVLATLEPMVVGDTESDPRVDADACRRMGAGSMVLVPLVHAGRGAGVLKVYSAAPFAVGRDEARVLGLLGHVIGTGLARAELLATLSKHASTDALTGLANRRNWDEQLARALAHAARSQETVSVAICDVDGLKRVNDGLGHAAGDALLRTIADRLRAGARAADLLARLGGDEFAVLLPGADRDAATDVMARLLGDLPEGHSVSVGIAEWDGREPPHDLVARADERMYAVKRRSRGVATAPRSSG